MKAWFSASESLETARRVVINAFTEINVLSPKALLLCFCIDIAICANMNTTLITWILVIYWYGWNTGCARLSIQGEHVPKYESNEFIRASHEIFERVCASFEFRGPLNFWCMREFCVFSERKEYISCFSPCPIPSMLKRIDFVIFRGNLVQWTGVGIDLVCY